MDGCFLKTRDQSQKLLRAIEKSQLSFHSFAAAAQCTMIQLSKLLSKNKKKRNCSKTKKRNCSKILLISAKKLKSSANY